MNTLLQHAFHPCLWEQASTKSVSTCFFKKTITIIFTITKKPQKCYRTFTCHDLFHLVKNKVFKWNHQLCCFSCLLGLMCERQIWVSLCQVTVAALGEFVSLLIFLFLFFQWKCIDFLVYHTLSLQSHVLWFMLWMNIIDHSLWPLSPVAMETIIPQCEYINTLKWNELMWRNGRRPMLAPCV